MEKRIAHYRKRVLFNLEGLFSFFPFLMTRKKPTNENYLFTVTVIVITQMGTGPDIFYREWLKKQ